MHATGELMLEVAPACPSNTGRADVGQEPVGRARDEELGNAWKEMRATLGDLGLGGMGHAQAVPVDQCLPLHRGAESSEPWSTLGTRTSPHR